jgi:hypothetical protein
MQSSKSVARPVRDEIPRVDDAISVGEDLDFQRRWWRFEKMAWFILVIVLAADALGAFGRGWLARAERHSADASLNVRYERVERAGTPSVMTVEFAPSAIEGGNMRLFSTLSLVNELGAQRIIPQPEVSAIGPRGITYEFPIIGSPAVASIQLEPSFPGIHHIELQVPGKATVRADLLVLP